ncbi:MAG: C-GCAxxG-C-C family (seleno)protein [Archaeoglobaceae archaeon]
MNGFRDTPWPYEKLDPQKTADKAYESAFEGYCMYGLVNAVVNELSEKIKDPWSNFPTRFALYGRGGVIGWGATCGPLNGAALLAYLILEQKDADELINELYMWYCTTPLPQYKPNKAKILELENKPVIAVAPLCYTRSMNFSLVTGYKILSPEFFEIENRVVADVTKKFVELLNAKFDGTFKPSFEIAENNASANILKAAEFYMYRSLPLVEIPGRRC